MKKTIATALSAALLWASLPWQALAQVRPVSAEAATSSVPGGIAGQAGSLAGQPLFELSVQLDGLLKTALPSTGNLDLHAMNAYLRNAPATPAQGAARSFLAHAVVSPELRPKIAAALAQAAAVSGKGVTPEAAAGFATLAEALTKAEAEGRPESASALADLRGALTEIGWSHAQTDIDAILGALFEKSRESRGVGDPAPVSEGASRNPLPLANTLRREGPRLPSASVLLARAASSGVSMAVLGSAVQSAGTLPEAAAALERLGLLKAGEVALVDEAQVEGFRYLLHRVWFEASPAVAPRFENDASWPVPSLVVRSGGVTYHIHGVVHAGTRETGAGLPGRPVRKLVRALAAQGLPLYSEERLPALYGYAYGKETLDQSGPEGGPIGIRPLDADRASTALRSLARRGLFALSLGIPLLLVTRHPDSAWAWSSLVFAASIEYLLLRAFYPFWKAYFRILAWAAEHGESSPDKAHHLRNYARALFGRRTDAGELHKVQLPMPLGYDPTTRSSLRSTAIATAIGNDEAANRGFVVHIIVGLNHAQEIAWALSRRKS